ncbi:MAG: AAA family ATPase [Cellulomonas sp.]
MDDAAGSDRDVPLIGRAAELDDLDDALASVSAGAGSIVLLEGEAGVGKSALVDAIRTSARLIGLEVRIAIARPARARPFGLIAEAMLGGDRRSQPAGPVGSASRTAGIEGELVSLLADADADADVDADATRQHRLPAALAARAEELAAALVRQRGDREPWLLVLEDLHEADDESLAVLYRLAHEGVVPHALVLATLRPAPRSAELAAVVAAWTRAGARYLELRPLSSHAAVKLAEAQLGASVGTSLRGSVLTAGGNPRFVTDVVRAVREAGALRLTGDGVVDAVGSAWTGGLDAVVVSRVAYLGPQVVQLLDEASVLGTSFVMADLADLTRRPVADCWRVLRHALAAGVVHARGDRLVFRHELVRSALYNRLDPSVRRALHERAARTLDAAGAPDAVVMSHRALAE